MKETKSIVTIGKRKTSIAKASIKEGKGIVRINSINLDVYTPEMSKQKIMEPLVLAGEIAKKYNINIRVSGGGFMSQAEAVRMAIARALVEITKDVKLKKRFLDYDRHLLVADVRRTEPQKPNRSAARAQKQTSKR
jgi:small subunit ribosomal protein S9